MCKRHNNLLRLHPNSRLKYVYNAIHQLVWICFKICCQYSNIYFSDVNGMETTRIREWCRNWITCTSFTHVLAALFVLLWCLECPGTLPTKFCGFSCNRQAWISDVCMSTFVLYLRYFLLLYVDSVEQGSWREGVVSIEAAMIVNYFVISNPEKPDPVVARSKA